MIKPEDIEKLTMNDLVAYYNANRALKDYYANTARMNECYRTTDQENLFTEPLKKQMKCTNVEAKIMDEFEKRLINEESTTHH
jgi:CRISPR/Cas system-associated protein Csx1